MASSSKAADVVDLDAIVRKWATQMFEATKTADQKRIPKEHLQYTVNWNRVRFVHHEPQFDDKVKPPKPQSHVLFRTRLTNSTDREQEYSIRAERSTTSECHVCVERAVTLGFEMVLSLKTPCEIFEANAGFKRELSVTNAQGQTIAETLTWAVDSAVRVPGNHEATAQLVVFEDEFQGKFSVQTDVSGKVVVSVNNVRDNNYLVKTIEGDLSEIVRHEMDSNGAKGFTREGKVISFTTNGQCHFRYGTEQHITLSQEPL